MNCRPPPQDQLLPLFLPNLNWDDPLSSIVHSPPAPPVATAISCEISSFVGDPNSMHVNCLVPFPSDPEFTERAARYSWFSGGNCGPCAAQFGITEAGKFKRVSSSQCLKAMESRAQSRALSEMGDVEFGSCREDSSVTDPASTPGEGNVKKRKAAPKKKGKFAEEIDLYAKKCRETDGHEKDQQVNCDRKNGKDNGLKAPEPPQDYIHVRARRGQATDSHSIAERVRREKISQRMKVLQDLVPGCNTTTGKALMLDEIINYVQSLQRQVEFLSMKLATVNPRLDFNTDSLITKESLMNQANTYVPNSSLFPLDPLDNLAAQFPFGHQSEEGNPLPFTEANGMQSHCSMSQIETTHHQPGSLQSSLGMSGGAASQVGKLWDDELHGVLQTGFGLNQENGVNSQSFHSNHNLA